MNYKLIDLKAFEDDQKGGLIAFEKGSNVPFDVKRAFYIYDTKYDIARGCHANKDSEFLFVIINGSCRVKIDDGKNKTEVLLNKPHQALYLNKMVWKEMYEFAYNSVLLVLASQYYDEHEYIRNYGDFLERIQNVQIP